MLLRVELQDGCGKLPLSCDCVCELSGSDVSSSGRIAVLQFGQTWRQPSHNGIAICMTLRQSSDPHMYMQLASRSQCQHRADRNMLGVLPDDDIAH